ncbi:MmcQ/YjbR family DNA-binding protein [Christensenellaceae bacterium OttesenSCG-928-L17]|nr:MmcQ/YjbR family DNA-binding protein [Christensenellaceae bacterium OttesenSCG-928-L17]
MQYEWLSDYCTAKPGAEKDFKAEWNAHRYMVGGKMFVMEGGDKNGTPILTVKLPPLTGDLLRKQYESIVPGYYMNKEHWNSIYRDGSVPDALVKEMIDQSYLLIVQSLPKKQQAALK